MMILFLFLLGNIVNVNCICHILYDFDETISAKHMFSILANRGGYSKDDQVDALNSSCDDACILNTVLSDVNGSNRLLRLFMKFHDNVQYNRLQRNEP